MTHKPTSSTPHSLRKSIQRWMERQQGCAGIIASPQIRYAVTPGVWAREAMEVIGGEV
ncbi:hypothetical protein GCM10007928_02400 [Sulfitobacter porphyrae]|nr:hypothetical protein GCM10007928_02400 [Sulfitobacter porphyrae]